MQLGMIGLGRMGANMVRRLLRGGHSCVVFDLRRQCTSVGKRRGNRSDVAGRVCPHADQTAGGVGHGPGREPDGADGHGAGTADGGW